MAVRSFYVSWAQAVAEGERLLEDLASFTKLNAIELTNYDADWSPKNRGVPSLVFPSQVPFKGLGLRLTTKERFETLERFMESARSRGFDVICNFAPLYANSKKFVPKACVDVTGTPVPGLNRIPAYGCPNNPDILSYGQTMIRETVKTWSSANLIAVNHVEFPFWGNSSLHEIFSCFCDSCKTRAKAQGIDFRAIRREVEALYHALGEGPVSGAVPRPISPNDILNYLTKHPNIGTWLDFRLRSMSEYVSSIVDSGREAARDHGRKVRMGLEFLPPTLSYAVGTDFSSLFGMFDWISPKFPEYLTGTIIPRITEQATKSKATEHVWLMSAIRQVFGLGEGPAAYQKDPDPNEGLTYSNAFDPSMMDNQMRYLAPLASRVDIHPYTWIYNGDRASLARGLKKFRSYGLDGYLIWGWQHNLTKAALKKGRKVF